MRRRCGWLGHPSSLGLASGVHVPASAYWWRGVQAAEVGCRGAEARRLQWTPTRAHARELLLPPCPVGEGGGGGQKPCVPKNRSGRGWVRGVGVITTIPKNSDGPQPEGACGGRCRVPEGRGGRIFPFSFLSCPQTPRKSASEIGLACMPKSRRGRGWAGGAGFCLPNPKNGDGHPPVRGRGGRNWVPVCVCVCMCVCVSS